jgi:hypothetical protein
MKINVVLDLILMDQNVFGLSEDLITVENTYCLKCRKYLLKNFTVYSTNRRTILCYRLYTVQRVIPTFDNSAILQLLGRNNSSGLLILKGITERG